MKEDFNFYYNFIFLNLTKIVHLLINILGLTSLETFKNFSFPENPVIDDSNLTFDLIEKISLFVNSLAFIPQRPFIFILSLIRTCGMWTNPEAEFYKFLPPRFFAVIEATLYTKLWELTQKVTFVYKATNDRTPGVRQLTLTHEVY